MERWGGPDFRFSYGGGEILMEEVTTYCTPAWQGDEAWCMASGASSTLAGVATMLQQEGLNCDWCVVEDSSCEGGSWWGFCTQAAVIAQASPPLTNPEHTQSSSHEHTHHHRESHDHDDLLAPPLSLPAAAPPRAPRRHEPRRRS